MLLVAAAGTGLLRWRLLTRPTLMFFPYFLVPALTVLLWARGGQSWRRAVLLALVPAVMMLAAVAPRAAENYHQYGTLVVTTQSGNHALDVVDQFIRLCERCVHEDMETKMHAEVKARLKAQGREDQQNPTILDGDSPGRCRRVPQADSARHAVQGHDPGLRAIRLSIGRLCDRAPVPAGPAIPVCGPR